VIRDLAWKTQGCLFGRFKVDDYEKILYGNLKLSIPSKLLSSLLQGCSNHQKTINLVTEGLDDNFFDLITMGASDH